MTNSSILKKLTLVFSVIFFVACDKDFNELGSNIIEDDIHHDNMTRTEAGVVAFDRATGAVQSNNLPLNSMGIYKNPAFGTTTAHFVSQVKLGSINPTFTTNVTVDTVYLYIPYFSRLVSRNNDGTATYALDSIYGNTNASMRLNIHENGFFLRDSDPGTTFLSGQRYYSDQLAEIDAAKNPNRLNNSTDIIENDEFKISAAQVERMVGTTVAERFAPGIFVHLDTDFFKNKIINAPAGKLINQNVFKEWFRGLYFNIQANSDDGAMATMDFGDGKITIIYRQDEVAGTEGTPSANRVRRTLTLDMNESSSTNINTINFFVNDYKPEYLNAINTSDEADGDDRLHIKGGNGSLAFIKLNDADLNALKETNMGGKVLINEANISFYIDQAQLNGAKEPLRIYLYDVENKRPIYDYYTDVTTNTLNQKYNKAVHGGIIQRTAEGRGYRYKIRLTNHINNIINKDSTNITLGLAVTESINVLGSASLKNPVNAGLHPVTGQPATTSTLPVASVVSPVGTILYGNTPAVPEDKRLKLEIFYTKP